MQQPLAQMEAASGTGIALFRHLTLAIEDGAGLEAIADALALSQQMTTTPLLIEHISLLLTEVFPTRQAQALLLIFEYFLENRLDGTYHDSPLRQLSESLVQPMQPAFDILLPAAACCALLKSGDLKLSLELLKDQGLIHTAYWYQYEHEFKATLDTTESTSQPAPTLLTILMAQKIGPDLQSALKRITTPQHRQSAYRQYDTFHEYITLRQQWLARMDAVFEQHKTAGADNASTLSNALIGTQEKFLSYFRATHAFCGYSFILTESSEIEPHRQRGYINDACLEWAIEQFGRDNARKMLTDQEANDFINYAYPFVTNPDWLVETHKLNVLAFLIDDAVEKTPALALYLADVVETNRHGSETIDWGPCPYPLTVQMRELATLLIVTVKAIQDLWKYDYFAICSDWLRSIADIRALFSRGAVSLDEYYKARAADVGIYLFGYFAAAYHDMDIYALPEDVLSSLSRATILFNDFCSYTQPVWFEAPGNTPNVNIIDVHRCLHPSLSFQESVDSLQQERIRAHRHLMSLKGTSYDYIVTLYQGWERSTRANRYCTSAGGYIGSRTTGLQRFDKTESASSPSEVL